MGILQAEPTGQGPGDIRTADAEIRFIDRDYSIDQQRSIFVQNAETHSHGFNAADLSLGPYRNAVIINSILGNNHYPTDHRTTFQQFGMTD